MFGGIAGEAAGKVVSCEYNGNILIENCQKVMMGGIAGYFQGDYISECVNRGGRVIKVPDDCSYISCGGIAYEWDNGGNVTNCKNYADITLEGNLEKISKLNGEIFVGGIAAEVWGGSIHNCINYGNIKVSNCYINRIDKFGCNGISGGGLNGTELSNIDASDGNQNNGTIEKNIEEMSS